MVTCKADSGWALAWCIVQQYGLTGFLLISLAVVLAGVGYAVIRGGPWVIRLVTILDGLKDSLEAVTATIESWEASHTRAIELQGKAIREVAQEVGEIHDLLKRARRRKRSTDEGN